MSKIIEVIVTGTTKDCRIKAMEKAGLTVEQIFYFEILNEPFDFVEWLEDTRVREITVRMFIAE